MSNIIPFDKIQVPAFLANRTVANDVFAAGIQTSAGFPTIGCKGTRFVVKSDGEETVLPTVEIAVVLISAKQNLDKTYYASKYDPNATEAKSPDCFSKDGIRPDASATMKQCESCAGCAMNQFGSGIDASGNPGKGKACADTKMLAIFANNGVYGFKLTPSSLKAFGHYVKETSRRGVDLSTAITVIGFDPNFSYPVFTFNFGGFLGEEQVGKIQALKGSPEVADIIGGTATLVSPAVASAPVQIEAAAAPVSDPFAPAVEVVAAVKEKPLKVVKAAAKPVEQVMPEGDDELARIALDLGL